MARENQFFVNEAPFPPMNLVKSIDHRLEEIDKVMRSKIIKKYIPIPVKHLKNRRVRNIIK